MHLAVGEKEQLESVGNFCVPVVKSYESTQSYWLVLLRLKLERRFALRVVLKR